MSDDNGSEHISDSSYESYSHEERTYFCYKCVREFNSNERMANCIFCNDGFVMELTHSNFVSEEEGRQSREFFIEDLLNRNRNNDNFQETSFDLTPSEFFRVDDIPIQSQVDSNGHSIRRVSAEGGFPHHHISRNIRHVLDILGQFSPQSELSDYQNEELDFHDYNVFEFNASGNLLTDLLERFRPILEENSNRNVIHNLPTFKVDESNISKYKGITCLICRDDFVIDDTIKTLPCKHEFHDECVVTWLRMRDSCPVCRKEIGE